MKFAFLIFLLIQVGLINHFCENNFDFTPLLNGFYSQQKVFAVNMKNLYGNGDVFDHIVMPHQQVTKTFMVVINSEERTFTTTYVNSRLSRLPD